MVETVTGYVISQKLTEKPIPNQYVYWTGCPSKVKIWLVGGREHASYKDLITLLPSPFSPRAQTAKYDELSKLVFHCSENGEIYDIVESQWKEISDTIVINDFYSDYKAKLLSPNHHGLLSCCLGNDSCHCKRKIAYLEKINDTWVLEDNHQWLYEEEVKNELSSLSEKEQQIEKLVDSIKSAPTLEAIGMLRNIFSMDETNFDWDDFQDKVNKYYEEN